MKLIDCKQVRDLGIGSFGTAVLVRDKRNGELVAVKYIPLCDVRLLLLLLLSWRTVG